MAPAARRAPPGPARSPPAPERPAHLELRFRILGEHGRLPSRAHGDDAGLDLHAAEPARLGPGERASVGTAVAVEIPPGHAGLVLPRSGLAAHHGITLVNAPGLIDPGYRGEIRVLVLNTDRDQSCELAVGDRIAQLLVIPCAAATPLVAPEIDATSSRGRGGFGSSGR